MSTLQFSSGLKSDATGFRRWLCHESTNGFEDDTKLAIILLFEICEASGKGFVGTDHLAQANKCPHDGNVDLKARRLRNTLGNIATPCSVKA